MKFRTSWKKNKGAEMGVGTMIIFIAMVLVAAVAASVLITTANKVREQAQNTGDQAINNVASGFIVQDVTGTVNADRSSIKSLDVLIRLQAGSPPVNIDTVSVQYISGSANNMMQFSEGGPAITFSGTGDRYIGDYAGTFYFWNSPNALIGTGTFTGTINGAGPYTGTLTGSFSGGSYYSASDPAAVSYIIAHPGESRTYTYYGEDTYGTVCNNYTGLDFTSSASGSPTSSEYTAIQTLASSVGGSTWITDNHVVQQGDLITISISNDAGNLNLGLSQTASITILPAYGSPTIINFVTPSYYKSDYVNLK